MFLGTTLIVSNVFSQAVDVQIGTGTATDGNIPINTNYGYTYSQQIYTVADLNAAGITGPALISKIRFYRTNGDLVNSLPWTVYLGNTTKTAFTSNTDWEVIGNLQQVYSGSITGAATNAWQEITFTTPFNWNGTSNLIIAIHETQDGYGAASNWRTSALGTNRAIYYRNDYTNPNPASPTTITGTRLGSVNQVQIVGGLISQCTTPSITNIQSNLGTNVCQNGNLVLSLENQFNLYEISEGTTYQWQSFDGTNWVDITDATDKTYSTVASESTEYQVVIGCSNTGNETVLAPISINVNQNPTVVVDIDASVVCPTTAVTVTASGANTYTWLPAAGLNVANAATVNALPTNSTVYTVTGTDANGCIGTAQTAITTYATVATETTTDPSDICEPNNPVAVEITTPAAVVGGNWEYRFLNADGTTEAQAWNTTNTYNFIPTADSVYTFYAQVKNSACGTARDSVKVSVVVGFGGDVVVTPYDCINLGGAANVTNPFGQADITTVYQNTFANSSNATGVAMTGSTAITNGRLVLTPSATSLSGAASFDANNQLGVNNSMNVSFLMTMDTPINVGADGLAYSFGDDVLTGSAPLQNGRGTKLRLSFDAIDNSTSNGNITGAYLVYGWTNTTTAFGPTSNGVLAFNPNVATWFNKTDVLVNLTIDASGKASVSVDGVTIFDNVQMPAAYMNSDVSTWKHHFGAQTGGYAFRQAVSNVEISAGTLIYGINQSATTPPATWQSSTTFTDLAPGTYNIWIAKDSTAVCSKNIETIVIENTNPVVDLGADTTICEGETLVLDAGNTGATYLWSGTNIVTQTLEVSNAGTYTVYATAANGCYGIGNINVAVNDAPTATGIFRQGSYPNFTYTVLNANNADSYDWNFGDGTTLTNAPATVSHYYTSSASVTVTATLTNDCGSTTVSQNYGDLSIASTELEGLEMYPNPTTEQFTISLFGSNDATVTVVSTTGAIVLDQTLFSDKLTVNTSQWESGIYFVTVSNNGIASTQKLIVK